MVPKVVQIEIYSRPGCHLCDEAKEVIERVRQRHPFSVSEINVESDPALEREYGTDIPVILLNGRQVFKHRVNERELEKKVKEVWNT